jgi:Protein of unknown function (DUF3500)
MKSHTRSVFAALALIAGAIAPVSRLQAHDAAGSMVNAAQNLIATFDEAQKAKAFFAFSAEERQNWHFIPKERLGLTLHDMTPPQRHLAYVLLGTGLSDDGFAKVGTIMSLEQILRELENNPEKRDPEKYHFSIFGDPTQDKTWGWRCEGHHCSVNFTLVDGKISGTPSFMGANPGQVLDGARKGLRVLGTEEEAGRTLVKMLTPEQQKSAILPGDAPKEMITEAKRQVDPTLTAGGLPYAQLTPEQKQALKALVNLYVGRMRPEVAAAELAQIDAAGWEAVLFAWIGGTDRGQPHYYRVQGPTFLIEYDNVQNGANHPHAVWREYKGDFGTDLLAEHLKAEHGK